MPRKAKVKALQKDWAKVNEGSPLQNDEFGMKTPERYSQEEEETTKIDEGKQTSLEESAEESDDQDLILAGEKLRLLQIEEKKRLKKEKLRKSNKETRELNQRKEEEQDEQFHNKCEFEKYGRGSKRS